MQHSPKDTAAVADLGVAFSDQVRRLSDQLIFCQREIAAGRFAAATETLRQILLKEPDHKDALYMGAVCDRNLKDYDVAKEKLSTLIEYHPEFGRAWQEQGHLHRDLGQVDKALMSYARACDLNPALEASWREKARLLENTYPLQAEAAASEAKHLSGLPRPLYAALNFMHEGKLVKAERLCKVFLKSSPQHVEALRILADIAGRLGVFDDAEFLLESAIEFAPDNTSVRLDYIQILRKRQNFAEALSQAKYLYDRDKENAVFASSYALQQLQVGHFQQALSLFDQVLSRLPDDPTTLTAQGHVLKTCGRTTDAIEAYRRAFHAKPGHGDAFYGLANLKTYQFSDQEVDTMLEFVHDARTAYNDKFQLCFALAKALEDRASYADSFHYYQLGNDLKRSKSTYDSGKMQKEFQRQEKTCSHDFFERRSSFGCKADDPIFIVGLPRAGSTLIEQILASHSQVDGTLELPNILALSRELRGRERNPSAPRYPAILDELTADQCEALGRAYLEDTQMHRAGARFFVDKMPNNFRHLGLIRLILPNAKIIDARRAPMDCCFSGYKQLFAEGQEFTYGLDLIGQYYRDYVALMDHWDEVLPDWILRVRYEDVVDDLKAQVSRILEFCDLPFEQSCVDFHENDRAVRTASSEQVRQPINRRGLGQSRPFEPWLGPLKQALGTATDDYRLEPADHSTERA